MTLKFAYFKELLREGLSSSCKKQPKLPLQTRSLRYLFEDGKVGSLLRRNFRVQSCASDVVKTVIRHVGHW